MRSPRSVRLLLIALLLMAASAVQASQVTATMSIAAIDQITWRFRTTVVLTNGAATPQLDNPGPECTVYLDPSIVFESAAMTGGQSSFNGVTNALAWNGSIPAGGSVTLTIDGHIRSGALQFVTVLSGSAQVCYDANDDGTNETCFGIAASYTMPSRIVDVTIAKEQLTPDPVLAGSGAGNLRYRVTLTAAAQNQIPAVFTVFERARDPLAQPLANVTLDAATTASGSWDQGSSIWTTGALAPGQSATLDVTMTVQAGATVGQNVIWNVAEVTATTNGTLARNGVMAIVRTSVAAPVPALDPAALLMLALALSAVASIALRR